MPEDLSSGMDRHDLWVQNKPPTNWKLSWVKTSKIKSNPTGFLTLKNHKVVGSYVVAPTNGQWSWKGKVQLEEVEERRTNGPHGVAHNTLMACCKFTSANVIWTVKCCFKRNDKVIWCDAKQSEPKPPSSLIKLSQGCDHCSEEVLGNISCRRWF